MITTKNKHEVLSEFLSKWSPEKVKNISLRDYAMGAPNYKETFSQWLENETEPLGRIGGIGGGGSFKFGIFHKESSNKYDSKQYKDDGEYAWQTKFGDKKDIAFSEIHNRVVQVINNSITGNFEAIENVDKLYPLFKWKVAFLYSDYKLFPIYKKDWLDKIASGLGYQGTSSRIVDLQKFIISKRPVDKDFFEWYEEILSTYIRNPINYFVVGSNYEKVEGELTSVLKDMYKRKVISVGFLWDEDLSKFYLKPETEIANYLYSKNVDQNSVTALKKFLNIKAGDIVAVKNYGYMNSLSIGAYAVVKPDINGNIYKQDTVLGQMLNVEFIETDVDLALSLNKSQTVHHITDANEINQIFGAYQSFLIDDSKNAPEGKGTQKKHTGGHKRTVNYSTTIDEFHNQLQQQFFDALKIERNDPDGELCKMEVGYVDIKYEDDNSLELYEVKTSPSASKCIRDAFGQITFYASKAKSAKPIKIFVVGPHQIKKDDEIYLKYLKTHFHADFEYIAFPLQVN